MGLCRVKQMKAVILTRAVVVMALESEPLYPGSWLSVDGCVVCAVGAVVRAALGDPEKDDQIPMTANWATRIGNIACDFGESFNRTLARELDCNRYVNALSVFYENACATDMATAREKTIEFVREHFPDSITIEVPA